MHTWHTQNHVNYKLLLKNDGFTISEDKSFLGASVDNVRGCECVFDCKPVVVEYKCALVHQHKDAQEAFLQKSEYASIRTF